MRMIQLENVIHRQVYKYCENGSRDYHNRYLSIRILLVYRYTYLISHNIFPPPQCTCDEMDTKGGTTTDAKDKGSSAANFKPHLIIILHQALRIINK